MYKKKKKWHIQKYEEVKLFSLLWCLFVFCTAGHSCNMHRNARRMTESCSSNLEDEMVKGTALNSAHRHITKRTLWSPRCHCHIVWVCGCWVHLAIDTKRCTGVRLQAGASSQGWEGLGKSKYGPCFSFKSLDLRKKNLNFVNDW